MNQLRTLWQVQVQGWTSDLEHLVHHFVSTSFRVSKDERDGGFLYESDAFAACQTSEEVLTLANDELCVLSGVLKMVRNSPEPLRTGAVYRRNAAGGRDIFLHIQETLHARAELGEVTVTVTYADGNVITKPPPPPRTVAIAQLAVADVSVAKAMRLLAAPDHRSWVGMYRIHEVIESDLGSESALKKRGWGSAQDLKRFKHSANSVTVAGDSARHGKEVEQPPKHPMSVDEAAAYLNYVLQSWLSSKGA
ncbi:hypothetical protein [Ottowia sp.]|uniref:hypothetical protein n=1 Tax=Ottowia sp. TaxID=1898956 RepID=UPI002CB1D151|nr:hypothetical protein [Ottowia sp.]HOB66928.1 hypothetical protein [Ottowia sp.]HPZ58258.1 hypothetical protein [Ottowia sp.]HQD47938.1 hypothetical protein [Ottowia sp.]